MMFYFISFSSFRRSGRSLLLLRNLPVKVHTNLKSISWIRPCTPRIHCHRLRALHRINSPCELLIFSWVYFPWVLSEEKHPCFSLVYSIISCSPLYFDINLQYFPVRTLSRICHSVGGETSYNSLDFLHFYLILIIGLKILITLLSTTTTIATTTTTLYWNLCYSFAAVATTPSRPAHNQEALPRPVPKLVCVHITGLLLFTLDQKY